MEPGDIYRTKNGNLYLVLPDNKEAYIGNVDFSRSDPNSIDPLHPTPGAVVVMKLERIPWKPD